MDTHELYKMMKTLPQTTFISGRPQEKKVLVRSLRVWDVGCRFLGFQRCREQAHTGEGKDHLIEIRNGRLLCKFVLLMYAGAFHFGGLSEFDFFCFWREAM